MRNFKLLLTALLLTLVWGFSFSSAYSVNDYVLLGVIWDWNSFSFDGYDYDFFCLKSISNSDIDFSNKRLWLYEYWTFTDTLVYYLFDNYESSNEVIISSDYFLCVPNYWEDYLLNSTNYFWGGLWVYWYKSSSDCSSIQSSLTQCQSDLSSCTNSCDTLVSQCQSDKETLQLSYSGCIETNSSLQNYNDSLALQLQECIEQWTWFSGATIINLYDMFRSDWINDYSLPITNNIKLPYWYRGFLDDWVLAIKNIYTLENAYSFDDDSFQNWVIENFWKVFLFFMSCGLTLVFLYAIRRYFIWLKSIK